MSIRSFFGSTAGLLVSLAIAAVGAWLLWAHTGHVLLAVPYLFLLACPLMHVMHRGHGHHSRTGDTGGAIDRRSDPR